GASTLARRVPVGATPEGCATSRGFAIVRDALRPTTTSANRAGGVTAWIDEALSVRSAERVAGRGRVAGVYAAWMPRPSLHACPEVSKGTDSRRPPQPVTGLRRAPTARRHGACDSVQASMDGFTASPATRPPTATSPTARR